MIFDPPNLSKRSTKSDSRAKVTKGLFIFSPKHGRMQKFTTFYQAGFENVQNFSIFTCMFSSGWGPYPNLKVLLCEKMHDHLGGRRGPQSGVGPDSGVCNLVSFRCTFFHHFVCLIVIWQCPSGTGYVNDTFICIQFSFFFHLSRATKVRGQ